MSSASSSSSEARFAFGKNWSSFLQTLDDDRIAEAERSLAEWLGPDGLRGKTFVDVGSGSGLFSLAARRLGAIVSSFDYDPASVACTLELKQRYFPRDPDWSVLGQGSALDPDYLRGLGTFDIVYSWGVLHHTGDMWRGLDLVDSLVKPGGKLFIMIYADRGAKSRAWLRIKRTYNAGPVGKAAVTGTIIPYFVARGVAEDLARLKNPRQRYREYRRHRGMDLWHDWIDWIGGYPYEFATPEQITTFYQARGYRVVKQREQEYLFEKV